MRYEIFKHRSGEWDVYTLNPHHEKQKIELWECYLKQGFSSWKMRRWKIKPLTRYFIRLYMSVFIKVLKVTWCVSVRLWIDHRAFSRMSVVCPPVEKWRAAAGDVSLHKNTMWTNAQEGQAPLMPLRLPRSKRENILMLTSHRVQQWLKSPPVMRSLHFKIQL